MLFQRFEGDWSPKNRLVCNTTSARPIGQLPTGQVPLPVSTLNVFYKKRHLSSLKVLFVKSKTESDGKRSFAVPMGLAWICLVGVSSALAAPSSQDPVSTSRLLTVKEGRSIVNAARELRRPARGTQDCSHLIHEIYRIAGFEYSYQSSFELYAGVEKFVRVRFPHTGDLIVWPGHVGIVVDPSQHSFYSLVRTGLEEQDYEGHYWKSRGTPRFYRYKIQNGGVLNAATTPTARQASNIKRKPNVDSGMEEHSPQANSTVSLPPKAASEKNPPIYGPQAPTELPDTAQASGFPSSILIAGGRKPPTREEVAESVSELCDAEGSVLRTDDPLKVQVSVVIVEQFSVERLEIKRDHGWAYLQIYSKASIAGGTIQLKQRHEKVAWELRRTESGWEALRPPDRAYVPHDVAVRNLVAQLARLTESDRATARQEMVLREESQLAQLLNALLASKSEEP